MKKFSRRVGVAFFAAMSINDRMESAVSKRFPALARLERQYGITSIIMVSVVTYIVVMSIVRARS